MDMAERQAMTLQFLRPAQVDGEGSVNTSRVAGPDGRVVRLPGGLAMADVPRLMPRVVLYHPDHRPRSLPARVDVVTGRGGPSARGPDRSDGPTLLVTDLAVIALGRPPRLVSAHPGIDPRDVVAATGFPLAVEDPVQVTPEPTAGERAAMEDVDPHALRGVEIRATRADALLRMSRLLEGDPR
jgi:glutaconate CoA-transferase subunit B